MPDWLAGSTLWCTVQLSCGWGEKQWDAEQQKHARQGLQLSERRLPNVLSYGNSLPMQVAAIILEEREERALRKAEMEAQKVGGGTAVVLHGYGRQQGGSGLQVSAACIYRGRWRRTCAGLQALTNWIMSALQAANLLEHEDEIRARPARTWFQTERQKRELAQRSKAAATGGVGDGALQQSMPQ